jgi:dihydrofolate reductase
MTAKLIYFTHTSFDGYIEDEQGKIDWTSPDEERQQFVNDALRPIGTHLYGRRMYETMQVWTQFGFSGADPAFARDFHSVWQAVDKVVYSKTLKQVSTPSTRLEQTFDVDGIRAMKSRASRDLVVSGHELAAHAFRAGLVDELKFFVAPIIRGGGKPSLPDGVRLGLELVDERHFKGSGGVAYLHYRIRAA